LGVFRTAHQSINRVVEPILITANQLAKGRGLAFEAISDEPVVVAVHGFYVLGRQRPVKSSVKHDLSRTSGGADSIMARREGNVKMKADGGMFLIRENLS
jgi:hypothetical protein